MLRGDRITSGAGQQVSPSGAGEGVLPGLYDEIVEDVSHESAVSSAAAPAFGGGGAWGHVAKGTMDAWEPEGGAHVGEK